MLGHNKRLKELYVKINNVLHDIGKEGNVATSRLREVLEVLNNYMGADTEIKIKYASKKARVSNYWKYFIGVFCLSGVGECTRKI